MFLYQAKRRGPLEGPPDAAPLAAEGPADSGGAGAPVASSDLSGPGLTWKAKMEEDATVVTFMVSNHMYYPYKDIRLEGFVIDGVAPSEKDPVTVAELGPSENQEFALHYDHLKWLGDDVPAGRADLGWAEKHFSFASAWIAVLPGTPLRNEPAATGKSVEAKGSKTVTGTVVKLGDADARALQAKREAERKAKGAEDGAAPKAQAVGELHAEESKP